MFLFSKPPLPQRHFRHSSFNKRNRNVYLGTFARMLAYSILGRRALFFRKRGEGFMAWLEWWNFMFLAPLLAGVAMAVLVVVTGGFDSGDHADGGGDDGVDGTEGHLDHADDIGDGDAHGGDDDQGFDLLGWFGMGKGVSLSLMLPVLLCTFGLAGLTLDVVLESVLRVPALYAPIAALGAVFASSLAGRSFAKAFVKFADVNRKTSIKSGADMVGCMGSAVFPIDATGGAANIKDRFGNIHRVVARTSGSSIAPNSSIKVVAIEQGTYIVEEVRVEEVK
jgi:membrane protein implicated in regulation of membrane protease activity